MYSDVPNLASAFGYTNASWTLKCDLTAEYVCRLLKHMDQHGYAQCTCIRMPLGAERRTVLLLIVSDGMKLAGIGIVIGLAVAFVLTRVMFSLLLM